MDDRKQHNEKRYFGAAPPGWFRLVCHNCGHKYPPETLVPVQGRLCCNRPRIRDHRGDFCYLCYTPLYEVVFGSPIVLADGRELDADYVTAARADSPEEAIEAAIARGIVVSYGDVCAKGPILPDRALDSIRRLQEHTSTLEVTFSKDDLRAFEKIRMNHGSAEGSRGDQGSED